MKEQNKPINIISNIDVGGDCFYIKNIVDSLSKLL